MKAQCTEAEFVDVWHRCGGSPAAVARELGISERGVYSRRDRMRARGNSLDTLTGPGGSPKPGWTFDRERRIDIPDGVVVVASDCHYWPGEPSVAHRALLKVIRGVKPRLMVLNGDVFDGGSIGRHDVFGWSDRPSAADELHASQERVGEIELALPKGAERVWNIGNHDLRFERNLASKAPQFANVRGMRLADHFPGWDLVWSTLINPGSSAPVMVKHRIAGGVHAGYNNTLKGGLSIVTGHTHQLEVKPWGDYRGRRWGVQTGTLADHHGPQFEYTENSPSPACSGFAVLTFRDGMLTPPELAEVIDGRCWFRGAIVAE